MCDEIGTAIDAGAGAGVIELQTAQTDTINTNRAALLTFTTPSPFGAASGGIATAASITSDTNAAGGTAIAATFFDSNNNAILDCSVGSGSGDIDLSSNVIGAGDTVSITSLTVTVPT